MRVTNEVIFNAVDASTNQTSNAFSIYSAYGWAAQFVVTGTVTGTLKAQGSCDPGMTAIGPGAPTNWTDITSATGSVSGAGTVFINPAAFAAYSWVRFVFTNASNTGNISGNLNLKGV
jgi:hypothetical protein